METKRQDVIIIGGGVAGLTCGVHLQRAGAAIKIIEAAPQVGGNTKTLHKEGYRLELGPNTFMGSAHDLFEVLQLIDMTSDVIKTSNSAKNRFIVRSSRLHAAPMGPRSFLTTRLLSLPAKLFLMTEPLRTEKGAPSDTAAQFFERRFGKEAARILAGAFISGVYAGDMQQLSAAAAFPLFWKFEQQHGSMIRGALHHKKAQRQAGLVARKGLFSIKGGLGHLTAFMSARLGDAVHVGEAAVSLTWDAQRQVWQVVSSKGLSYEAGQLVIATPPTQAAALLRNLDQRLAEELATIEMAPVAVAYISSDKHASRLPQGFGFLAPRGEGVRSLGTLFSSLLFADRAPEGRELLTAYIGGVNDKQVLSYQDEELFELITKDWQQLNLRVAGAQLVHIERHKAAIPQFGPSHLQKMHIMAERLAALPTLHLAGNYLLGVGMKDAVSSGKKAAQKILQSTLQN
jgi:oxygen-dependent protoporphyrinogen oxidase